MAKIGPLPKVARVVLDLTDEQMEKLSPLLLACWHDAQLGEGPPALMAQPEDSGEFEGKMRVAFFRHHEALQLNEVLKRISQDRIDAGERPLTTDAKEPEHGAD